MPAPRCRAGAVRPARRRRSLLAAAPLGAVLRAQLPGTAGVRWLRQEGLPPTTRADGAHAAQWLSLFGCWSARTTAGVPGARGPVAARRTALDARSCAGREAVSALGLLESVADGVLGRQLRGAVGEGERLRERLPPRPGTSRQASARPSAAGCRPRGRRPSAGHQATGRPPTVSRSCTATSPSSSGDAAAGRRPGRRRAPRAQGVRRAGPAGHRARATSSQASGRSSRSATGPGAPPAGTDRLGRPVAAGTARRARRRPRPPGPGRPAPGPAGRRRRPSSAAASRA